LFALAFQLNYQLSFNTLHAFEQEAPARIKEESKPRNPSSQGKQHKI
jgi:hypothetical protein